MDNAEFLRVMADKIEAGDPYGSGVLSRRELADRMRRAREDVQRLSAVQGALLGMLETAIAESSDTVWLTANETVAERLASLFLTAGGDRRVLIGRWPERFD